MAKPSDLSKIALSPILRAISKREQKMTLNNRAEIEWAPKVSLAKIRSLYTRESQGICDEELIDEVGTSLYHR
jgi:hypothetical protein